MFALGNIFDTSDFPARWNCGIGWQQEPFWGWLHIFSDLSIWLAYMAIPLVIAYFLRKRPEFIERRIALLFAAFIFFCGLTHLVEAGLFYWPAYRLSGLLKFSTAAVSWGTVFVLFGIFPRLLTFRSPQEMQAEVEKRTEELQLLTTKLEAERNRHQQTVETLSLALSAGGMGTWEWDLNSDQVQADHFQQQLTGLHDDEFEASRFFDGVHPEDRVGLQGAVQKTIQGEAAYDYEFRYRAPGSKDYRWLAGRGNLFVNPAQDSQILRGVNYDITTRKEKETRLRLSTLAVESARNGIIIADAEQADMPIIYCNEAFTELTGYSETEILGRNCRFLQGPETDPNEVDKIREAVRSGQPCRVRLLNYTKQGRSFWNDLSIAPVYDDRGQVTHFVGIQTDATERVEYEQRLKAAELAAVEANTSKSRYLANVSHEIRTPLTAILGCAEMICHNSESEALELADLIRDQGKLMLGLLNDILDLSKIEAGKLDIIPEPVNLQQKFARLGSLMTPLASHKGLRLEIAETVSLPHQVRLDPLRFRQILINLINNAIKFTESGFVRVQPVFDQTTSLLSVKVIDTGKGISEEDQNRIFEAFQQSSGSDGQEGTGLGLTISQRLAHLMGGEILVSSRMGEGSTFELRIPLEVIEFDNTSPTSRPDSQTADPTTVISQESLKQAYVVVAEDNSTIQFLMQRLLGDLVGKLQMADNGLLAIEACNLAAQNGKPVDLILMDRQMPKMNGLQATKELRAAGYTMPIIALTAAAYDDEKQECLEAGCNDCLAKPIDFDELLRVMNQWLTAR